MRRSDAKRNGSELTAPQARAAVLLAGGMKLSDVARELRVSRSTMYRWTLLPAFQAAVELERSELLSTERADLAALRDQALRTLRDLLAGETPAAVRVRAAAVVLGQPWAPQPGADDQSKVLDAISKKYLVMTGQDRRPTDEELRQECNGRLLDTFGPDPRWT